MSFDRRRVAVAVAGLTTFFNVYTPQAVLPTLAASFGASLTQVGLTVTASLLAVAIMAPFVGAISDRLGRKRLIVLAAFGVVIPTLLVATSPTLAVMVAWRFAQGLMLPFIFAVTVAYIGDECDGPEMIRAAGAYSIGAIIGGFSGRLIEGLAADFLGWRLGFVVLAALTACGAAFIQVNLPRETRFRRVGGGIRATLATYADHLANARVLATCAVGFGMLFSVVGTFTFVNFLLAAPPFGLGPSQLGFVFAVYLVGAVATGIGTALAVRFGRRAALVMAAALTTAGLLLTLVPTLRAVVPGLAAACGGLFIVQSLSLGFIGTAVRRAKSSAVGLYVSIYYTGGALGGVLPAWLWHHAGWPGVVALMVLVQMVIIVLGLRFWTENAPPRRSAAREETA